MSIVVDNLNQKKTGFVPVSPKAPATLSAGPCPKGPGRYLSVYVNCFPLLGCAGRQVSAEAYTTDLRAEVAREHRALDWTTIEYFRGRGFLSAKVRAKLAGLDEHLVITIRRDSELFRALGELLTEVADELVEGLR